jgi:hypothetical protein
MITEMGSDLDVLVVQAQSAELAKDTCEPDSAQVTNLNILLNDAPTNSKKMLFATWAEYDTGDEICTFSKLECTQQDLKDHLSLQILPVGQSFRYIADSNCDTTTTCNCDTTTCGYVSDSCSTSRWSDSGDGIFADYIHQSEASGAWLVALVVYGGMQTPVCLPSPELLAPSGLSNDLKTELATAAAFALTEEYGSDLYECSASSPTLSPTEEEIASPTVGGAGGAKPEVVGVNRSYCTPEAPCPQCYGDCDTDDDCQGNLQCYQRDAGGQTVPSCSGGEDSLSGKDFS